MNTVEHLFDKINLATLKHDIFNTIEGELVILEQLLDGCYGNTLENIKPILIALLKTNNNLIHLIEHCNYHFPHELVGITPDLIIEFDILDLLNSLYQEYYPLSVRRNLKLHYETSLVHTHNTIVTGNIINIRRMLSNLLHNALQYTVAGDIFLRLFNQGNDLAISIKDTGLGIEAEDLADIFLPFYRGSNSASIDSGSGLGLYIAKMVAKAYGFKLSVDSIAGQGTKFTVIFPYQNPNLGQKS